MREKEMAVFGLDRRKRPLMPCPEQPALSLLERGRAVGRARGDCNRRTNLTLTFIDSEKGAKRVADFAASDAPVLKERARCYSRRRKIVHGFQMGNTMQTEVLHGNKAASHVGCVAVRSYYQKAAPSPRRQRRGLRRGNSR